MMNKDLEIALIEREIAQAEEDLMTSDSLSMRAEIGIRLDSLEAALLDLMENFDD